MLDLTESERKRLRKSIIDDLTDPEVKTPADKIKLKIDVLVEDKKTDIPRPEVHHEDVNEEDIGEFPGTVH
jgi:hypothetical protein